MKKGAPPLACTMLIRKNWTMREVKMALEEKEGIPAWHQRLNYMGRVLSDEATAKELGMGTDSCIKLEFGLRGGGTSQDSPAKSSDWGVVTRGAKKKPESFSVATPEADVVKDDKDKKSIVVDNDLNQRLQDWKDKKTSEMKNEAAAKTKNAVKAMEIPRPDLLLPGGNEKMKADIRSLVEKRTQDELREQRKAERDRRKAIMGTKVGKASDHLRKAKVEQELKSEADEEVMMRMKL